MNISTKIRATLFAPLTAALLVVIGCDGSGIDDPNVPAPHVAPSEPPENALGSSSNPLPTSPALSDHVGSSEHLAFPVLGYTLGLATALSADNLIPQTLPEGGDLSSRLCSRGTAVAQFTKEEKTASEANIEGFIEFTNCEFLAQSDVRIPLFSTGPIGANLADNNKEKGAIINGGLVYGLDRNNSGQIYEDRFGGILMIAKADINGNNSRLVTINLSMTNRGKIDTSSNQRADRFISNMTYSVNPSGGGGYLVRTTQDFLAEFNPDPNANPFDMASAGILVTGGSENSEEPLRLFIRVLDNSFSLYLDNPDDSSDLFDYLRTGYFYEFDFTTFGNGPGNCGRLTNRQRINFGDFRETGFFANVIGSHWRKPDGELSYNGGVTDENGVTPPVPCPMPFDDIPS